MTGVSVTRASPHRLFVYIVPKPAFKAAFGDVPYGVAAEEILCPEGGGHCAEATTGIYLTTLERGTLKPAIVDALGLVALKVPIGFELPTTAPRSD